MFFVIESLQKKSCVDAKAKFQERQVRIYAQNEAGKVDFGINWIHAMHVSLTFIYWFTDLLSFPGMVGQEAQGSCQVPGNRFFRLHTALRRIRIPCRARLASKNPVKLTTRSVLSKFCKNRLTVACFLISCLKFQQHIHTSHTEYCDTLKLPWYAINCCCRPF